MAAFIRRFIQGRAAAAADPHATVATPAPDAPDDATVVTPAADAPDDAVVVTPAADGETSQATVPSIPASGQSDDFKTHKRKSKRKRKSKMPIENDNPRKVPKHKSDTPESASASASAVQGNTRSINVDVPNYQGVDIAWNLNANGTISGVTFSFGGSTS
ncbi:hypothetical protein FN846DRAFT_905187 [Sphaerosporella brunnea]|uniref:Uncharacterized protein n=1 Tax=Sphaerosporella brunnea TaxID=1250544 RepID=A0A5J5F2S9_9PEZI|nr:hypothetical protein FN846DRAFT_905187 [Sphaerosporella brunnea]